MRHYLIDRVTRIVPGEHARGVKCVSLGDEVLHDHLADYPVMPGASIVEAAAQLAGFLLETTVNQPGVPPLRALMVQIRQAKFYEVVGPGRCLEIDVRIASRLEAAAEIVAEVRCEAARVAVAKPTFVLKRIESERLHEQRRYVYRLWTRDLDPPVSIV